MFNFITGSDYRALIKDGVKNMVTDGADLVRITAESFARQEIEGYLNFCYDVERILNFKVFDYADTDAYKAGDLVIDANGTKHVCVQTATAPADLDDANLFVKDDLQQRLNYDEEATYTKGQTIIDQDRAEYLCIQDAPAGTKLTDTSYFFLKRNDLIVMLMVDISAYHYHARINQRQVPVIRLDRYEDAVRKLKAIRKSELQPPLPKICLTEDGEPQGVILITSNKKRDNCW